MAWAQGGDPAIGALIVSTRGVAGTPQSALTLRVAGQAYLGQRYRAGLFSFLIERARYPADGPLRLIICPQITDLKPIVSTIDSLHADARFEFCVGLFRRVPCL